MFCRHLLARQDRIFVREGVEHVLIKYRKVFEDEV